MIRTRKAAARTVPAWSNASDKLLVVLGLWLLMCAYNFNQLGSVGVAVVSVGAILVTVVAVRLLAPGQLVRFAACVLVGGGAFFYHSVLIVPTVAVSVGVAYLLWWTLQRRRVLDNDGYGSKPLQQVVTSFFVERVRIRKAVRGWEVVCNRKGWTVGENKRPLKVHVKALPSSDVVLRVNPGRSGVDEDQVLGEKSLVRQAVPGCRQVAMSTTEAGTTEIVCYFTDPLRRRLSIRQMGVAKKGYVALGIVQSGAVAQLVGHYSTLIGGLTGQGKSSAVNALLAGQVRDGVPLQLFVSDTKGGMEMAAFGKHVGQKLGCVETAGFVTTVKDTEVMIKKVLGIMRVRQNWLAKTNKRKHVITPQYPRIILILDEFLSLTSLCKAGAAGDLGQILSQGRACEVLVYANAQMGHASELQTIRNLFPQRMCCSTPTPDVTDTILGRGATAMGALCHKLKAGRDMGLFYVLTETTQHAELIRVAWVSDAEQAMVAAGTIGKVMNADRRPEPKWKVYQVWTKVRPNGGRQYGYVGITQQAIEERNAQHRRDDAYWQDLDESTMEITHVASEKAARALERQLTHAEWPLYNIQNNGRNPVRRRFARTATPKAIEGPVVEGKVLDPVREDVYAE